MRERLTFQHLLQRCVEASKESILRNDKTKPVIRISFDEFNDLKMDLDFVHSFNWAGMDAAPKEFNCYGIRCTIEERKS